MTKTLNKVGSEETHLNIMKAMYDKSTANIIPKGKNLKAFPLRSGIRQRCPLLFNIVLKLIALAIRQYKVIKGMQIFTVCT